MIGNYLKIAWRNLWINKRVTFINISGLAIGMAAAILITFWVQNELSFDTNQPAAANIYRVRSIWPMANNEIWNLDMSQYLLGDLAVKEIPEVEDAARLKPRDYGAINLHYNNQIIQEKKGAVVDDHWFKMFHYDFVDGTADAFNKNPFSLILTQSAAKRYFGSQEAVGKVMRIDTNNYEVQAVVKDNPANTSFSYDLFIPLASELATPDYKQNELDWGNSNDMTFLRLKPGSNVAKVSAELTAIEHRNNKAQKPDKNSYSLVNIKDMHFETGLLTSSIKHGNKTMVNVFIALAILLLVTACINYVNLTTARASARSKEISVRKIVGAGRLHLFGQFMYESLMVSLLAVIISFALVQAAMPWFRNFTDRNFAEPITSSLAWAIIGITLLVSFVLNGLYPALLLSSFQPLKVFRGKTMLNFKDAALRKSLVVVQFTISVVLIVGTLVIYRQLKFMENVDLGYDKSHVFTVDVPFKIFGNDFFKNAPGVMKAMKEDMRSESAISAVSMANNLVDDQRKSHGGFDWAGRPKDFSLTFTPFQADADFYRLMNLKMKEGRWITDDISDKHNVVLNETAVQMTGLRKPYIGQRFVHQGDTGVVVGIVKDFHYQNLHEKIGAMVIGNNGVGLSVYLKTAPGNTQAALAAAQRVMKKYAPDDPFEYHFVDDRYNSAYKTEQQASVLIALFAGIAILVSAMGLLGLATFAAQQKVKEIGIRKVLGASVQHIVSLLSVDFIRMILIASVIAFPIAWWAMNKWLQGFAYKITLSWWIFAVSGAAALLIALITVSYQAVKAALANPVNSLRSE
jgi:predicted permease